MTRSIPSILTPTRTLAVHACIVLAAALAVAHAAADPLPEAPPALPVQSGFDPLPDRPTLEEFLELVRWRSPALAVERTRVDAARADRLTAGALPNPTVSGRHQPGRRGEPGERELAIEQPLPVFGQRGYRIRHAELGIGAAQAQVAQGTADVLRDAAQAYVALQVAQARETRWREALGDVEAAECIVAGQVEAGARSRYERTRVEVERAALSAQAEAMQAARAQAASRLAALAGAPGWQPRAEGVPRLPAAPPPAGLLWADAQERLPAVRAARAEEAQARQRIELERREAWPVPVVGVGRLRDADGRHTVLGVSVTVPLFDRNEGPIARARAEADGQRLRRDAVVRAAETELLRAADQFQRRRALADRYAQQALAPLPELRRMAQDAYTLGRGGILEFIDALQAVAERQTTYLDLLEDALQAELDLRAATGALGPRAALRAP